MDTKFVVNLSGDLDFQFLKCPMSMGKKKPEACLGPNCMAWVFVQKPDEGNFEGACGLVATNIDQVADVPD
ncbi:MAG: hypothetical protein LBO64_08210 [Desulfovibrio sp.]|jgi:hypothetical protein|nr:hypothetical protein [Desulfovibrio sp.]